MADGNHIKDNRIKEVAQAEANDQPHGDDREAKANKQQTEANKQQTEANETVSLTILLASKSPRRKQLLEDAGIAFSVRLPETPVDEALDDDEWADPAEASKKLAEKKAGAVVQELLAAENVEASKGLTLVVGADTIVVLDGEVFGKPRNYSHAKGMLRKLSGRTHEVITAVSLWLVEITAPDKVSVGFRSFTDASAVTFKALSDGEIDAYLHEGESFDKAGAYAAQGKGAALIERVDGDLDTVIGLPVTRLLRDFPEFFRGFRVA